MSKKKSSNKAPRKRHKDKKTHPGKHSKETSKAASTTPPASGQKTIWGARDTQALIRYLAAQISESGDGGNFKKSTFAAAAEHLRPLPYRGLPKTGQACKNKYTAVSRRRSDHFYANIAIL